MPPVDRGAPRTPVFPPLPAWRRRAPLVYWPPIALAGLFTVAFIGTLAWIARSDARPSSPRETRDSLASADAGRADFKPASTLPTAAVKNGATVEILLSVAKLEQRRLESAKVQIPPPIWDTEEQPPLADVAVIAEPPMIEGEEPARPAANGAPAACGETFGTAVAFARNPTEASKLARQEKKLAFYLHVSGDFEDPDFT